MFEGWLGCSRMHAVLCLTSPHIQARLHHADPPLPSSPAGGPGKGMHSRLYTRVLNAHPWMHNCTALNSIYNDSGLIGIFASAESAHAGGYLRVSWFHPWHPEPCPRVACPSCPPMTSKSHASTHLPSARAPDPPSHRVPAADEMVSVLCREMQAVANDVPAVELERAKAATISSVLMNLESKSVVAEDIGRQVDGGGGREVHPWAGKLV